MHPVSEVEVAEITKIVENADRYLQISFAEDLYLYCQANNINFGELREALNTKWNVNILEPRDGIGGHCLPKDSIMFLQSSKSIRSKIIQAAMEVDEDYRKYRQTRSIVVNSNNPLMEEQKRTALSNPFSCRGIKSLNQSKNKMTDDQIVNTTCNLIDK